MSCDRYDFESWREFSYMDEENLEKAERCEYRIVTVNDIHGVGVVSVGKNVAGWRNRTEL